MVAGIILAAGAGSRFGGAKQLADLDGHPLLEYVLRSAADARLDRVVLVLGSGAEEVRAGVRLHGAEAVVCERWEEGLSASLACGLALVEDAEAVVVLLGDQPRVPPEAITRLLEARGGGAAVVRATYGGEPGYPLLLEEELFGRMRDVTGDRGARNLLMSAVSREIPCDDLGGGEDVDTPAELDRLRAELRS